MGREAYCSRLVEDGQTPRGVDKIIAEADFVEPLGEDQLTVAEARCETARSDSKQAQHYVAFPPNFEPEKGFVFF